MLFKDAVLKGIAEGAVTLAFRRWKRAAVRPGTQLRTGAGVVEIGQVEVVAEQQISEQDAGLAGYSSAAELRRELASRIEGAVYRIELRLLGPDPRIELRERGELDERELAEVRDRLARWDRAASGGPWTTEVLGLIQASPATRAAELAAGIGWETPAFKRQVRKLKELGLTESLEVGYRLSARGAAVLSAIADHRP